MMEVRTDESHGGFAVWLWLRRLRFAVCAWQFEATLFGFAVCASMFGPVLANDFKQPQTTQTKTNNYKPQRTTTNNYKQLQTTSNHNKQLQTTTNYPNKNKQKQTISNQNKQPQTTQTPATILNFVKILTMKLYIKNMVCNRCRMVVESELRKLGYNPLSVELGEVILDRELAKSEKELVEISLHQLGFSIIDDKKSRLIESIKKQIIELVHKQNSELKINLSDYLSENLHQDYNYLSGIFSEVEGTTIEKYFISQKIERVKELLVYDELTLSEIADQMNYSSVAHLSSQFKKVTGLTPSHFKNIRENKRKPIDEV